MNKILEKILNVEYKGQIADEVLTAAGALSILIGVFGGYSFYIAHKNLESLSPDARRAQAEVYLERCMQNPYELLFEHTKLGMCIAAKYQLIKMPENASK